MTRSASQRHKIYSKYALRYVLRSSTKVDLNEYDGRAFALQFFVFFQLQHNNNIVTVLICKSKGLHNLIDSFTVCVLFHGQIDCKSKSKFDCQQEFRDPIKNNEITMRTENLT